MNIIGKWKVKELLFPTPNGMVTYTPENLPDVLTLTRSS